MDSQDEISRVVVPNLDQLRVDLDRARQSLQRARQMVAEKEREVSRLEALIDLAGERSLGT
jgi:hypothetical protein